jgi:hypothetical protein
MSRLALIYLAAALVASVNPTAHAEAQTTTKPYYVGTCKPGKPDFTTIQEAVKGVPPGVTINVCPGMCPEQVTIQQPLTLSGVQSGDNANVVVTAPSGGLYQFMDGFLPFGVAPLIAVFNSGGPVNISGISLDARGGAINPAHSPAGILYESSPGTVSHVLLLQPQSVVSNFGVLVVDSLSISPTVTIENSAVSLANEASYGIFELSPTSAVNVVNNYVHGPGQVAIYSLGAADAITGNTTDLKAVNQFGDSGILAVRSAKISGNTISNSPIALQTDNTSSNPVITNNTLIDNGFGFLSPGGGSFNGNTIISTTGTGFGVNLSCSSSATLSGNTFIGTATALVGVPSGVSLQKNAGKYFGVATIEQLCP